jgi:hypothetical protein
MLKFLVKTFYQSLFSHFFLFSNFPLAILFPSIILFPSKSFPNQKAQSKSQKLQPKKPLKAKPKGKKQNPQALFQLFNEPITNSGKQTGAEAHGEECDIVTGGT